MRNFNFYHLPYIDGWKTPLGAALRECEVHCVALCCGMDAFDVTVERVQHWANRVSAADLECARSQVLEVLAKLQDAPDSFFFLDCDHPRREVIEWVENVRSALNAVNPAAQRGEAT